MLKNCPESIAIRMVLRGFQAEWKTIRTSGDAIHTQQTAACHDSEQLSISGRGVDHLHERICTRRVYTLRFECGIDRPAEVKLWRPPHSARRHSQSFDRCRPFIEQAQPREVEHGGSGRYAQRFRLVDSRLAVIEQQDA